LVDKDFAVIRNGFDFYFDLTLLLAAGWVAALAGAARAARDNPRAAIPTVTPLRLQSDAPLKGVGLICGVVSFMVVPPAVLG